MEIKIKITGGGDVDCVATTDDKKYIQKETSDCRTWEECLFANASNQQGMGSCSFWRRARARACRWRRQQQHFNIGVSRVVDSLDRRQVVGADDS